MTQQPKQHFDTRAIHAGEAPDPTTGAHGVPMYGNVTFAFSSYDQVMRFEHGEIPHFVYQRYGGPTVRCLELKLADLEGAESAVATSNGMSAISSTLLELARDGGHLLASQDIYTISDELFKTDIPASGASVTRVDCADLAAVEAAITPQTRAIYVESYSNPRLVVADIAALAEIAHRHDALLVVDNTFLSPALFRPIEHGADIVLHSATKYLSGSGHVMAGVVAGKACNVGPIGARVHRQGGTITPFAAWMLLQGVKTLPLRMERHAANAQRIAATLAAHPAVERVHFPGLPDHPGHATAERQSGYQHGGVLSLSLHGGAITTRAFIDALQLCTIAVSLGEATTLVFPLDDGLIRMAVGLEHPDDLVADIEAGLRAAEAVLAQPE